MEIASQNENMSASLMAFLSEWDAYYLDATQQTRLFKADETAKWSQKQRIHFIKVFYHCRGHFHEFLWHLANFAPDSTSKELILSNIRDEFGGNGLSHEKLYRLFAEDAGVDLTEECLNEETYLPFVREFNKTHIKWLNENDWTTRISGFAALERLDIVDYYQGKKLAESLTLKGKALTFFNVHINSNHFDSLLNTMLISHWEKFSSKVKKAFYFIGDHQINLWQNLSDEVFNYHA